MPMMEELLEKLRIIRDNLKNNSWSPEVSPEAQFFPKGPVYMVKKLFSMQTKECPVPFSLLGWLLLAGVIYLPATQRSPTALCRAPSCLGDRLAGSRTQKPQSETQMKFL